MGNAPRTIAATPRAISQALCANESSSAHLDPALRRALATRVAAVAPARSLGPIRLDGYVMTKLLRGIMMKAGGPFHWSPRATRRIIGGPAAHVVLAGICPDPLSAVRNEVDALLSQAQQRNELRSGSLARWLLEAPESLRVAVIAEASSYATELLASVDFNNLDGLVVPCTTDPQWAVPGAPWISLRGRRDLEVATNQLPRQRAILALRTGSMGPYAAQDLGIVALASALSRPDEPLPCQIVGLWSATGRALVLPVHAETIKGAARAMLTCVEALNRVIPHAEAA